ASAATFVGSSVAGADSAMTSALAVSATGADSAMTSALAVSATGAASATGSVRASASSAGTTSTTSAVSAVLDVDSNDGCSSSVAGSSVMLSNSLFRVMLSGSGLRTFGITAAPEFLAP